MLTDGGRSGNRKPADTPGYSVPGPRQRAIEYLSHPSLTAIDCRACAAQGRLSNQRATPWWRNGCESTSDASGRPAMSALVTAESMFSECVMWAGFCREKPGTEPFATASGQALGYSVYANRVYLADFRTEGFRPSELEIANHLGIGLIQLSKNRCREVLSSPFHNPVPRMSLELIARLALANCQLCGTVFECGRDRQNRLSNVTKGNLPLAVAKNKGLVFWLRALSDRKKRLGIGRGQEGFTVEKRFVCPECVQQFFGPDAGRFWSGEPAT